MRIHVTAVHRAGHCGAMLPRPVKQVLMTGDSLTLEIPDGAAEEWSQVPGLKVEAVPDVPAAPAPVKKGRRSG